MADDHRTKLFSNSERNAPSNPLTNLPSDQSDMQPVKKSSTLKPYRSFGFSRRNKDTTTTRPSHMTPEEVKLPGNIPASLPSLPLGVHLRTDSHKLTSHYEHINDPAGAPYHQRSANCKMPSNNQTGIVWPKKPQNSIPNGLADIYSIDTGNAATCNLPSYRTHGLGHHVQNRPNNNRGRGRGNKFKNQRFDNSQPYNNRGRGNRGGRGRGRGRGGRGGGQSGHEPVQFRPDNLIKDSFFKDPWSHLTPKKVTTEEIRRASDTRSNKRLFNAGTSSFN